MKTYEKPKLIALSISGNNTLCKTCDIDVILPSKTHQELAEMWEAFIADNYSFTTSEDTCVKAGDAFETTEYCKFTAPDNSMPIVINS